MRVRSEMGIATEEVLNIFKNKTNEDILASEICQLMNLRDLKIAEILDKLEEEGYIEFTGTHMIRRETGGLVCIDKYRYKVTR